MDYINIFTDYLENKISLWTADNKMSTLIGTYKNEGNAKKIAQATLCRTYFKRYNQYNSGNLGQEDLLIFIRDFVLFLGRFRFPRLISDAVERGGAKYNLFLDSEGVTDVVEMYPSELDSHKKFIQDVYNWEGNQGNGSSTSSGDDYVCQYTIFNTYKSIEQKIAVHGAVELPDNHTMMISLPTGGGKSLVTQILAAVEHCLTLVVVPTVSLAKDQCLQALSCITDEETKKGIFWYSSNQDNIVIVKAVENESARLIFTSPEAILKSVRFGAALKKVSETGYLHNIVIDEAHIVSDWGVNFRPDFQIFSVVLNEWRKISGKKLRTYLLSATLSDDTVDVLFSLFGSEQNNVQYRCDALRPEPRYIITESHNYDERQKKVIEMIKCLPKPLIVYVIEPTTAKKCCKLLKAEGLKNVFSYTGDTSDKDRNVLLENWKNDEFDIMIATSAFGMGVDKSNVRTIIHSCVPENLSRFYQEVGRAGRDGLPSLSVLSFYTGKDDKYNDLTVAFGLVKKSILRKENLLIRLNSILTDDKTIVDGDTVIADLNTVPNSFTDDEAEHAGMQNMCWNVNALLLLHRQGYISIFEAKYDISQKTYLFSFKLNNIELLFDSERLSDELTDDRQKEYDIRVAGYHKMADIVHRPKSKCWGKHFVSLFPLAQPICSGCPIHDEQSYVKEDYIRIREKAIIDIEPAEPNRLLRRYMGVLNDLLIPIDEYSEVDRETILEKAQKLNVSCVVCPDDYEVKAVHGCMHLTHSEFLAVAANIPWLLRNGIMILLDDNEIMSNKLYDIVSKYPVVNYRKVWCCKIDTKIKATGKTLHDFLNCRTCSLDRI